jgi:hypothetical protein
VNPEAFKIIDGKLYLNYSRESANSFEASAADNISTADKNWNKLKNQ